MRKNKLLVIFFILAGIAAAVIGYVSFLYWQGSATNYEPPKQPAVSPQERVQADLQHLSRAVEAYFIKNLEYPPKLELLIPEFMERLESDPLSGKTYQYRLYETEDNSRYRISVPDPQLYHAKELYLEDGLLIQK